MNLHVDIQYTKTVKQPGKPGPTREPTAPPDLARPRVNEKGKGEYRREWMKQGWSNNGRMRGK